MEYLAWVWNSGSLLLVVYNRGIHNIYVSVYNYHCEKYGDGTIFSLKDPKALLLFL